MPATAAIRASVEYLRENFNYDPDTGEISSRFSRGPKMSGHVYTPGQSITVLGQRIKPSRLAWKHYYGEEPPVMVDHKDRITSHNWIDNLRASTPSENQGNATVRINSVSGLKGAFFRKNRNKKPYHSKIRIPNSGGRYKDLGYHPTAEAAHEAYYAAGRDLYGEFFCNGSIVTPSAEKQRRQRVAGYDVVRK